MKRTLIILGLVAMGFPISGLAAGDTVFDRFFEEAKQVRQDAAPSEQLAKFVVDEMRGWHGIGIVLSPEDITRAIRGTLWDKEGNGLCQNKVAPDGTPHVFVRGAAGTEPGACDTLRQDILSLVQFEQQADQLGTDLLTITNGAELSIADEPGRPMDMPSMILSLRRLWSGTGASVAPWNTDADSELSKLDADLLNEDLHAIVTRFHHGYYREKRENDPRFANIGNQIRDDLLALANKLGVVDNPSLVGVFAVPRLQQTKNIGVWARANDIGLFWLYPTRYVPFARKPAKNTYPSMVPGGAKMAYPYAYEGTALPPPDVTSPLCSRTVGRQGYLCREQPTLDQNCLVSGDPTAISLVLCSETNSETESGPVVCQDFDKLFADTGLPLIDPQSPGQLNPALQQADVANLCTPETKTLYQDDITSHACYVGHCVLQSMNQGHTMIPNRNPVVLNESTSPYLACIRPDPQVGLYLELAESAPYPLPEYLGHFLVRDFDRQYCATNGGAPNALAWLCRADENEEAARPDYQPFFNALRVEAESSRVEYRQDSYNEIATLIGERVAVDQTVELDRKIFARLAHIIQQTADLLFDLRRAPLTTTACPWTGPFESVSPF